MNFARNLFLFCIFLLFIMKTLKMKIWTSAWSAQQPKTGPNIQQITLLLKKYNFIGIGWIKPHIRTNFQWTSVIKSGMAKPLPRGKKVPAKTVSSALWTIKKHFIEMIENSATLDRKVHNNRSWNWLSSNKSTKESIQH